MPESVRVTSSRLQARRARGLFATTSTSMLSARTVGVFPVKLTVNGITKRNIQKYFCMQVVAVLNNFNCMPSYV